MDIIAVYLIDTVFFFASHSVVYLTDICRVVDRHCIFFFFSAGLWYTLHASHKLILSC